MGAHSCTLLLGNRQRDTQPVQGKARITGHPLNTATASVRRVQPGFGRAEAPRGPPCKSKSCPRYLLQRETGTAVMRGKVLSILTALEERRALCCIKIQTSIFRMEPRSCQLLCLSRKVNSTVQTPVLPSAALSKRCNATQPCPCPPPPAVC